MNYVFTVQFFCENKVRKYIEKIKKRGKIWDIKTKAFGLMIIDSWRTYL